MLLSRMRKMSSFVLYITERKEKPLGFRPEEHILLLKKWATYQWHRGVIIYLMVIL
jgi:hypothetical protein